ncbi:MAG TPA: hypothetical protein VGA94_00390 [Thermodesulfobacteriota bacterium]
MRVVLTALIFIGFFSVIGYSEEPNTENSMIKHPEWYIKISDFNVYSARGVGIIHHVTIENTSNIAYQNIKVRVRYKSGSSSPHGTVVATETGVLPVTLPPHSKKTYLEGGSVFGATSSSFYAGSIEVLGAIPLTR